MKYIWLPLFLLMCLGWKAKRNFLDSRPYNISRRDSVRSRWWSRRMCAHLLMLELQNYNSLLNYHWQENVGSHQKKILHIQGQRRSPNKMVQGVKSHLESNPIPTRDTWRTQTKPYAQQEIPQRLSQTWLWVFECLLQRYGSAVACCRGRGSGCSRPGCGITLLEVVTIKPTIEPPEFTQNWGNRLLEGTNKILCAPRRRRKEQWPHKRLTQTCLWVPRSLQRRRGLVVACCRVRGTECGSAWMGPFEEPLSSLPPPYFSGQTIGKEHSPTQEKIGLKIYWAWSHPSKQDLISPTVSLSHQETSIKLSSLPSEVRQNENHNHRKLINLILWTTALSNSKKLWAMLRWPPKTDGSWWRVLTKPDPL